MAYDEVLAGRIRTILTDEETLTERKMFGGIAFMVAGNMACGVIRDDFMARVGPDGHDDALTRPHVRPMEVGSRPMRGMVSVGPAGTRSDADLAAWVRRCVAFARSLPPK